MARSFNGSADYYERGSAVLNAVPQTFACWFNVTNLPVGSAVMGLIAITTNNATNHRWNMSVNSSGQVTRGARSSTGDSAVSVNTIGTGVWAHACGRSSGASDRRATLNGDIANQGSNTTTINVNTGVNRTFLGIIHNQGGTPAGLLDGRLAEAAIWNVSLSDTEVEALARRKSPLMIRPGALVFYAPLIRLADDRIAGTTLTAAGNPTIQPHLGIEYRRHKLILPRSVAVPPAGPTLLQMQRHGRRGGRLARTGGRQ